MLEKLWTWFFYWKNRIIISFVFALKPKITICTLLHCSNICDLPAVNLWACNNKWLQFMLCCGRQCQQFLHTAAVSSKSSVLVARNICTKKRGGLTLLLLLLPQKFKEHWSQTQSNKGLATTCLQVFGKIICCNPSGIKFILSGITLGLGYGLQILLLHN